MAGFKPKSYSDVGGGGSVTAASIGLGNVDNTSDANKPVSTAQQGALDLKTDKTYVDSQLSIKVNVQTGKGLSSEDFTTAEKTKLGNITDRFKGLAADAAARNLLVPAPANGDTVIQNDTDTVWFYDGAAWVDTGGTATGDMLAAIYDPTSVAGDAFNLDNMVDSINFVKMTAAERTKLTSTEQLTAAEKALIPTQAETDKLAALPTRVGLTNELGDKQDTLVSGTNLRTINGQSLLGSADLVTPGVIGVTYVAGNDEVAVSKNINIYNDLIFQDPSSSRTMTVEWFQDTTDPSVRNLTLTSAGASSNIELPNLYVRGEIDTTNLWCTGNVSISGEFKSIGPNIEFKNSNNNGWYSSGGGGFRPYSNGTQDIGQSSLRVRTYYSVNSLNASSDERYKDFGEEVDHNLLRKLSGKHYTWKPGTLSEYQEDVGFSAQEVAKVLPELVNYDVVSDFYSMSYERLVVPLVNYCNAQQNELDTIRVELAEIKALLAPKEDSKPIKSKRWYCLWLM
jgi:hypothetical protein